MRLDSLKPGSAVKLSLAGREEIAFFLGILGEGTERVARFAQTSTDVVPENVDRYPTNEARWTVAETYEWAAYRYKGGWAFGTSAERLSLVEVL